MGGSPPARSSGNRTAQNSFWNFESPLMGNENDSTIPSTNLEKNIDLSSKKLTTTDSSSPQLFHRRNRALLLSKPHSPSDRLFQSGYTVSKKLDPPPASSLHPTWTQTECCQNSSEIWGTHPTRLKPTTPTPREIFVLEAKGSMTENCRF